MGAGFTAAAGTGLALMPPMDPRSIEHPPGVTSCLLITPSPNAEALHVQKGSNDSAYVVKCAYKV